MLRQIDQEQPFSPQAFFSFGPSPRGPKGQLMQLISGMEKQQQKSMSSISERCSNMQFVIASIEVLVGRVGERAQQLSQQKQNDLLGDLKMKQYQFIVSELRGSLSKQVKKQERLAEELETERRKMQKYREQIFRLQAKNSSLTQKTNRLDYLLKEKSDQIDSLNQTISKLNFQNQAETRARIKSNHSDKPESLQNTDYYKDLEGHLEELQEELQTKVGSLETKNKDLSFQIKKIQDQLEEQRSQSKVLKKQTEDMSVNKYELEIKLKKETQLNADLEDSYNKLLQNSKTAEIALHKQIQEYKIKETTLRNDYKKEKKQFRQHLSALAEFINNNTKYYLMANNLNEQVEEVKKLHEKTLKKKTEQITREVEYMQTENKKLKLKNEQIEKSLNELQKKEKIDSLKLVRNLSERETGKVDVGEKFQKKSEANSSFVNKSTDKSEDERYRSVKDKYESRLDLLRKDLKAKQSRINELQKQQYTQFEKSKQKILELQLSVSEKMNEIRKFEMRFKQKDYEINQLKSSIKDMQTKIGYLNERWENEKDSSSKMLELKVQNYEEKLKNVKNNYKELEKKEQEKTFKYNKLKNKYQKYEVEASQSLKRKIGQIDQLLKENNRLKTDNKLLEEKININNIISSEVNQNTTPDMGVNQDLIEQIEMERDRISSELMDKQRQCSEMIQVNSKMSSENLLLKRQLRQFKAKFEELQRDYRQVDQEYKFSKQKIMELSKQQEESAHENNSIFKKQLEKSIASSKKLQKMCEKYKQEREQLQKEINQLKDEVTSYRNTTEKLKDKNIRISNQILDETLKNKKLIAEYEIKLSEYQTKESQLVDIINYKNREGEVIRESMKGEELLLEVQAEIKIDKDTTTRDLVEVHDASINTDQIDEPLKYGKPERPIIPSQILLNEDEEFFQQPLLQKSIETEKKEQKAAEPAKEVNYFTDLVEENENLEDNFDICEEGEEINIGQTAMNLQIKEVFNCLRKQVEKIFNEEDISIDVIKFLPKQLEDDFNDFSSYVKEKIFEIKNENNLSFIMAEAGNEPEEVEAHIAEFLSRESQDHLRLRKIIEEKQYMITSLMNEKTEQQNTINQITVEKEEMEEQNENRFMNQGNLLKAEIKKLQKANDFLSMNFQSLKNVYNNTLKLSTSDGDNYQDICDNIILFINICNSNEEEKKKLAICLENYKKMRGRLTF